MAFHFKAVGPSGGPPSGRDLQEGKPGFPKAGLLLRNAVSAPPVEETPTQRGAPGLQSSRKKRPSWDSAEGPTGLYEPTLFAN
jgi:hypothetical protein